MSETPRRAPSPCLARLEAAWWLAAVLLLAGFARGWAEASLFQQRHLRQLTAAAVEDARPRPAPGSPIARLAIPRLGVDVVVAEGTSPDVLRRAAGRIASSALPGKGGNVAIAAHRDSFFRPLRSIEIGDLAVLGGAFGERRYRVEWTRVVEPGEIGVAGPTEYPALTLVTCYPFRYVGSAPQRFVVRARALGG